MPCSPLESLGSDDPAPFDHPDLVEIGARLQRRYEAVLAAEREAAVTYARRVATLRDRLLEAEDAGAVITIRAGDGLAIGGVVARVAADHVEVGRPPTAVRIDAITAVVGLP